MVVGHSQTGEMDKVDGPYYFFDALKNLSAVDAQGATPAAEQGRDAQHRSRGLRGGRHRPPRPPARPRQRVLLHHRPRGHSRGRPAQGTLMKVSGGPRPQSAVDLSGILDTATQLAGEGIGRVKAPLKDAGREGRVAPGHSRRRSSATSTTPPTSTPARRASCWPRRTSSAPPMKSYAQVLWDYWLQFLRPGQGFTVIREVDGLFNQMIGRPTLAALRRKVKGRVAVVTGATSGIGKECALRLARGDGATVILVAQHRGKTRGDPRSRSPTTDGKAQAYSCDVSLEPQGLRETGQRMSSAITATSISWSITPAARSAARCATATIGSTISSAPWSSTTTAPCA